MSKIFSPLFLQIGQLFFTLAVIACIAAAMGKYHIVLTWEQLANAGVVLSTVAAFFFMLTKD